MHNDCEMSNVGSYIATMQKRGKQEVEKHTVSLYQFLFCSSLANCQSCILTVYFNLLPVEKSKF